MERISGLSDEELKTPLEYINTITEINDIHEFMMDEVLDEAMNTVIKLIAKPDVPLVKVGSLIVQMQAWSALFQLKGKFYMTMQKGESIKKNIYFTASEQLDKLAQALKYLHKS